MKKKELIFMGPPASGKGTQTKMLRDELGLPHVDTGSMLRAAIASGSETGKIAKSFMDKGNLVPTDIVAKIIKERLSLPDCEKGFILDGYPRSIEQAQALEKILDEVNKDAEEVKILVINIDISQATLVDRIVNRRFCKECGKIYNLKFWSPKIQNRCDSCSGRLVQRDDDTEEIAYKRFQTYFDKTQPLIDFYSKKSMLKSVDGTKDIKEVFEKIKQVIVE